MKFKLIPLFIILQLGALIFTAQGCVEDAEFYKDLTPKEAFAIIQKNRDNPDFVILDVRTAEEFGGGHIENAINLNFRNDNFKGELSRLDRNNIYLVYCQAGIRSGKALEIMKEMNFKRVYHLPAGILGWEKLRREK